MKMIYTVITLVALSWFLLWAFRHEGIPESISSLFYRPKTQWTYTMVISGVGALMTLVAPTSILHYAGISLILGTAAPDYRDADSLSKYFHFGLTFITAFFSLVCCGRDLSSLYGSWNDFSCIFFPQPGAWLDLFCRIDSVLCHLD